MIPTRNRRLSVPWLICASVVLAPSPLAPRALPLLPLASSPSPGLVRLCMITFGKNPKLPARVEDSAAPCMAKAAQALTSDRAASLYLVGTADKVKDNEAGHGRTRTEQDMTGEDIRYADVAAYRAINTKAYLVRWQHVDPARVVPVTSYEDGQTVEFYLLDISVSFKSALGRATAPILSKPCTVKPCASGPEEFLIAQPRGKIASQGR